MKRERLIQERKKRNLTRSDVARDLGISEIYVRKIENGQSNPGRKMMISFSAYYGLGFKLLFPDLFLLSFDKKFIGSGGE